jgi:hypothetical protein
VFEDVIDAGALSPYRPTVQNAGRGTRRPSDGRAGVWSGTTEDLVSGRHGVDVLVDVA